jgi:hypothetical protein
MQHILSDGVRVRKAHKKGFPDMRVGSIRVSSDTDRQTTPRQRDALLEGGVAPRHLVTEKARGVRDHCQGLQQALA